MTEQVTSGSELAVLLEQSYFELRNTLAEFDVDEQAGADLGEGWTPISLLAHIAFWDVYQRRRMEAALAGETASERFPPPDEKNDERLASDRLRQWEDVAGEADSARNRLIMFVQSLKEDVCNVPVEEGGSPLYIQGLIRHMVRHTEEHHEQLLKAIAQRSSHGSPA